MWFRLSSGLTGGTFLKKKTDPAGASASASAVEDKPCQSDDSGDAVEDAKNKHEWCDKTLRKLIDVRRHLCGRVIIFSSDS